LKGNIFYNFSWVGEKYSLESFASGSGLLQLARVYFLQDVSNF